MLNISFFELIIIILVGIIFIGPEELPTVIRSVRKIFVHIKSMTNSLKESINDLDDIKYIKDEVSDVKGSLKEIVGLDGNIQKVYDISEVMPEIKTARNDSTETHVSSTNGN